MFVANDLINEPIASPIPRLFTEVIQEIAQVEQVLGSTTDFTDPNNWFPAANLNFASIESQEQDTYTVSIPSLNIEDAEVKIGGEDLDKSLIQYPGTSLPGSVGSPVIFGHSVLRQFYNPSIRNSNRYNSIFSTIMTMKQGEEIFVDYNNVTYTYQVTEKLEIKPEDVYILEQRTNNRELKLITCVPEGTYLRRGVVKAQLVEVKT